MEKSRFRDVLVQRIRAQADLIGAFTTHRTLTGSARERAIVHVLREMLPRRFEALTGAIAAFTSDGRLQTTDRQIDLMVVDTWLYPTLFRDGDTAVVFAEAVRAIVEIKSSTVGPWAWVETLAQSAALCDAVDPSSLVPRAIFAYESGGREDLAVALRILNWVRTKPVDAEGVVSFAPRVKRGRRKESTMGTLRKMRPATLRPPLLPAIVLGGSGLLGLRLPEPRAGDPRFGLAGPATAFRDTRGGQIEVQVARLLEFLLTAAKDMASSTEGDRVHPQLRTVIGSGADLPFEVILSMKDDSPDVFDPTTEVSTEAEEEQAGS